VSAACFICYCIGDDGVRFDDDSVCIGNDDVCIGDDGMRFDDDSVWIGNDDACMGDDGVCIGDDGVTSRVAATT